jgi:hypothetical protein
MCASEQPASLRPIAPHYKDEAVATSGERDLPSVGRPTGGATVRARGAVPNESSLLLSREFEHPQVVTSYERQLPRVW